jgi:hypothetical protein
MKIYFYAKIQQSNEKPIKCLKCLNKIRFRAKYLD